MLVSIDNFLRINFEISLDTYFRLTDSKLKNLLKAEIKNFLENQEEKELDNLEKILEVMEEEFTEE